jgi:FkbM family methyltransferase
MTIELRRRARGRAPDPFARWLIVAFVLVASLLSAVGLSRTWLPAKYGRLWLQGRVDPRCSFGMARAAAARFADRMAITDRDRANVRLVRTDGGIRLYETARGPVWTSHRDSDAVGTASNFHATDSIRWRVIDGVPEGPVRAGDVVLDAGAHVGESTFAALDAGASRVIAIEPDPDNLAALRKNLAGQIADGRVTVIDKGVYDREGLLSFAHQEGSRDGTFVEGEAGTASFPITTIDRLVTDLALTRVDFIKMDIEGSEIPALKGASDTLRRFAPKIAVGAYHKPGDLAGIEALVMAAQPRYSVRGSFCLDAYGDRSFKRMFPLILYFSSAER